MNIQSKLIEIHAKYGVTEMANYHIQKLFDTELCAAKKDFYESGKTNGVIITKQEYEEKLRWIPVEEKLPEKQGHYLVKAPKSFPKNCIVVVAEFYEDNNTFYSESSDCPIEDATHWRSF